MSSNSNSLPQRSLACVLALCAVAIVVLLSAHPGSNGRAVIEVLQMEARNRVRDGVVHGGFILISAILIVCLARLSLILERAAVAVTTGFVAFCLGAGALMMSMVLDGLVVPAIAVRCLSEGTASSLASAQTLLLLCATCIKFLMPIGLLFESVGMLSFSVAMVARKWIAVGGFGIAAGIAMLSSPLLLSGFGTGLIIGGMLALCVWYAGVAIMLWIDPGKHRQPTA